MATVYLFVSGKGGVGKSTITANLAILLAGDGKRVVLIDSDLGLRSQDILLNLESSVVYDLMDVARGVCLLSDALIPVPRQAGLQLLPAAQFARTRDLDPRKLKKMINLLKKENDYILIDCAAGLDRGLRNALNAVSAPETIVVVTPDDLSMRDADQITTLLEKKKLPRPRLLVNRLQNDLIHDGDMYSAQAIASLMDLSLLGEIPEDPVVYPAQLRHRLVIDFDCEARQALIRIAGRMQGHEIPFPQYGRKRVSLFRRLFGPEMLEVKRKI